jgi:hypothetical protein
MVREIVPGEQEIQVCQHQNPEHRAGVTSQNGERALLQRGPAQAPRGRNGQQHDRTGENRGQRE